MRITAGKYKNRKIQCPPGVIRPAMDRMRESLFSILGNLEGESFLDLFSGSGLVGIEAASRGANPITLVEMDRRKGPVIRKNLEFVEEDVRLVLTDANRYIRGARASGGASRRGESLKSRENSCPSETSHAGGVLSRDETSKPRETFDIIYADPPFPLGGKQEFVQQVSESGLLKPDGLFIIHHPGEEKWEPAQGRFVEVDKRTYGRSILRFYRYGE